jgi:SNF2 family DNA or RNA helicase
MVEFNLKNNTLYLSYKGEYFEDYLSLMRKYKIEFSWDEKKHIVDKRKFHILFNELPNIDMVRCYPSYNDINKFCEIKPEVEYYRNSIKEKLLKFPPVKGKIPYENYQSEDIQKTIATNRLYNASDCGMGKSYEQISALNHLEYMNGIDKYLIICPPNVLYNWKVELKKFYYQDIKPDDIYIVNIKNRYPFQSEAKFVLCTYRSFLMISDEAHKEQNPKSYTKEAIKKRKGKKKPSYRRVDVGIKDWLRGGKGCLIIDEAHNIKNYTSRSYKVIAMQKDYFKYRYLLSGTPFPKNIIDAYTQINLIDPVIINMTYEDFKNYVAVLGTSYSEHGVSYIRPDKEAEILKKLEPYMIRRKAHEVLNLPDHIIKKNYCEFNDFQLEIYKEIIRDALKGIKEEKGRIKFKDIKQKFPYLIQAIHNPCLLKDKFVDSGKTLENLLKKWKFEDNSKLEIMDDLLSIYAEENKKSLIWGYHPNTLENLYKYYSRYNPLIIRSEMSTEERKNIVETFRKNKNNHILITSSLMMSEGMTIIESSRNIIFERNYEFNKFYQLTKRNYRIGQKDIVITNILLLLNSLEIAQDKMLEERQDLNDNMFDEEYLNRKQMEKLFEGDLNIFNL